MEWALLDGLRVKASSSGTVGACPGCGSDVRAKCGEIVSWHWAHINADCDPWTEPETEWHRKWKSCFPTDWQEVTKPPHRADVAGPDFVLEIQRSPISPEEISEREQFYGQMVWLLNGYDFWDNLVWIKANEEKNYHEFRWKHIRKTWLTAKRLIFIDTPYGLFRVRNIRDKSWKVLCGSFVRASYLLRVLDASGRTQSSPGLIDYDNAVQSAKDKLYSRVDELRQVYAEYDLCKRLFYFNEPWLTERFDYWDGDTEMNWLINANDERKASKISFFKSKAKKYVQAIAEQELVKINRLAAEQATVKEFQRQFREIELERAEKIAQIAARTAEDRPRFDDFLTKDLEIDGRPSFTSPPQNQHRERLIDLANQNPGLHPYTLALRLQSQTGVELSGKQVLKIFSDRVTSEPAQDSAA